LEEKIIEDYVYLSDLWSLFLRFRGSFWKLDPLELLLVNPSSSKSVKYDIEEFEYI
jgi:hypothetical protein